MGQQEDLALLGCSALGYNLPIYLFPLWHQMVTFAEQRVADHTEKVRTPHLLEFVAGLGQGH